MPQRKSIQDDHKSTLEELIAKQVEGAPDERLASLMFQLLGRGSTEGFPQIQGEAQQRGLGDLARQIQTLMMSDQLGTSPPGRSKRAREELAKLLGPRGALTSS